jgi:transcriptional regulator with XRE-family HTH domain
MDTQTLAVRARARRELPDPARARALRLASGVQLSELAELIGVSRRSLWLWETGQRKPRGRHMERYAEALGVLARELGASP